MAAGIAGIGGQNGFVVFARRIDASGEPAGSRQIVAIIQIGRFAGDGLFERRNRRFVIAQPRQNASHGIERARIVAALFKHATRHLGGLPVAPQENKQPRLLGQILGVVGI